MNTRWDGANLIMSFDSTSKLVVLNTEETKEFDEWVNVRARQKGFR